MTAIAVVLAGAAHLAAQGGSTAAMTTVVHPQTIAADFAPPIPTAPDSLRNWESKHPAPPLPAGPASSVPQPSTPEVRIVDPYKSPIDTGVFKFFQNDQIPQPPSSIASRSSPRTPEPSNGLLRDTVLQTGNWQAAISPDNGETWNHVDPDSFIPTADGGFCCDQQVIHVPAHDMVIWLLQYSTNASGNNRYRFAIAKGRDKLRSLKPSDWYYYDVRAHVNFGYASGVWLDYPDIAEDGTHLYVTANAINANESVVWRMNLSQMAAGVSVGIGYQRSSVLGGWNYRLAKGVGGNLMAFGTIINTTQVRVYTWPTASGTISWNTRTVASWVNATGVASCPDGRPFAGRAVGRIRGAFGSSTEFGMMWPCAQTTGRPYPYTRIARFRVSDRTLVAEHDMWGNNDAFIYADGMSNSLDHIGGVVGLGGPSRYVTCGNWIVDQYDPWPVSTVYVQATGSAGPDQDRFGDYFTVRQHPLSSRTFMSNGSTAYLDGNLTRGAHRYVWFGRDDYEPTWVTLSVQSTPITGVSITQEERDLDSLKDGLTNYTRRFAPQQGYTLTAPLLHTVGSTTYSFFRWAWQVQPGASFNVGPVGDPVLTLSTIGSLDDVAEARYLARRTLNVQSLNPNSGVQVALSAPDINGNQNGTTSFTRYFRDGDTISLSAPSSVGFNPFKRWVVNGTVYRGNPINVAMTTTRTAVAEYWQNVGGKVANIGAGCAGSSGAVPVQSISWPGGQQGPQQGSKTLYSLDRARPNTVAVLHFGISTKQWGAFALPLKLDFLGMKSCVLYHDLIISPTVAVGATGSASLAVVYPVDPAAVGGSIYTTFGVIDFGANAIGVVHSNAMETVQGGNR